MAYKVVYDTKRDRLLDEIESAASRGKPRDEHVCPSCQAKLVDDNYERCYGCQKKWWTVYDSCFEKGWPSSYAKKKADDSYPCR